MQSTYSFLHRNVWSCAKIRNRYKLFGQSSHPFSIYFHHPLLFYSHFRRNLNAKLVISLSKNSSKPSGIHHLLLKNMFKCSKSADLSNLFESNRRIDNFLNVILHFYFLRCKSYYKSKEHPKYVKRVLNHPVNIIRFMMNSVSNKINIQLKH